MHSGILTETNLHQKLYSIHWININLLITNCQLRLSASINISSCAKHKKQDDSTSNRNHSTKTKCCSVVDRGGGGEEGEKHWAGTMAVRLRATTQAMRALYRTSNDGHYNSWSCS